jgi:putative transposase
MGTDAVRRLKALEQENNRLKKILAERDLEIELVRAELQKKSGERAGAFGTGPACHWQGRDSETRLYADECCPIGVGIRVQNAG